MLACALQQRQERSAGRRTSPEDRLAILFTCGQCQARTMRSFSRRAYDNGVVIVQCPGCNVRHLVADRLGWFGTPGSVEDFMKEHGEGVHWNATDGSIELTADDAQAWAQMAEEQRKRVATDDKASDHDGKD